MGVVTRRHPSFSTEGQTRRHRPDYWLLVLMIVLMAIGLVVVISISPALAVEKGTNGGQFVAHQMIALGLGLAVFVIAAHVPLGRWQQLQKPLLIAAAATTLLALVMPVNIDYPAHRWVRAAGFSFQSVELLKFALIMWLGSFLSWRIQKNMMSDSKKTQQPLLIALVATGIVVAGLQSDFGSFGVIVAIMGIMAFAAGLPMKRVLIIGGVIVLCGVLAIASTPYRRDRLSAFLHPQSDCLSTGYQACQALIAVGSGGMIGLGLGRSVQAYGYLPEAENDSIFAIYAEKFGFVGVVILLALLLALFTRIKRVAERAPDDFSRLIVLGILVWLSCQTVINIGAMVGILPLKGITLPLISSGGSSVLMIMAALGVVFQVSRYTLYRVPSANVTGGSGYEDRHDRRGLRGTYHTSVSRRP